MKMIIVLRINTAYSSIYLDFLVTYNKVYCRNFISTGKRQAVKSLNPLKPNDLYMRRTAQLTSRRCILYIY